jgi:hypothetical protein
MTMRWLGSPWFWLVLWPLLVLTAVPCGMFAVAVWIFSDLGEITTHVSRTRSPDGRYDLVERDRVNALDTYETLFLAVANEERPEHWFEIAPQVDGSWNQEWLSPTHLLLTDCGAWKEDRQPYKAHVWRDVRIDMRAEPFSVLGASPDKAHALQVVNHEDSRGRKSEARLERRTANESQESIDLVPLGPWRIAGEWLGNDRLRIRIERETDKAPPALLAAWRGIAIEVAGK